MTLGGPAKEALPDLRLAGVRHRHLVFPWEHVDVVHVGAGRRCGPGTHGIPPLQG